MRSGVATVAAALALAPASAGATTRYVAPSGADSGKCPRSAPCSADWALNGDGSVAGDTVVVGAGTYADQPVLLARRLTITADEAAARPVFRTTAAGGVAFTIGAGAAGTVVEHIAVRAKGEGAVAVDVQDTAALDDMSVSSATGPCLRSSGLGLRIDDTDFVQTGVATGPCLESTGNDSSWNGVEVTALNGETAASYSGDGQIVDASFTAQTIGLELAGDPAVHRVTAIGAQRGIVLSGTVMLTDSLAIARGGGTAIFAGSGAHQLLNVTAWGEGQTAYGIRAANGARITLKNSIARGEGADLSADPATQTLTPDCAVFTGCPAGEMTVDHSNFDTSPGVLDGGSNQSADPRFSDPVFEDFHLRKRSPVVDAGSFEFSAGSADRDGLYRWLGQAPDMGAFEYPAPRRKRPKTDAEAPRLTRVVLSPRSFHVTRRGTAFSAAAGAPRGTALSFTVSEDADLVLTVARPGRDAEVIGTIVRAFRRGTHRMTISGEIDRHFLEPGRYVLAVLARDTAQNLSRARRISFTVTR